MRNQNIQALRGLLMLWIVLFHYTSRISELYPDVTFPFQFEHGGHVGVLFFFVISGFLFAKGLTNSDNLCIKDVGKVVINKYWRLWSSYIFAVIAIFVITNISPLPGRTVGIKEFLINCILIYHPKIDYVDSAHWFIANLVVIQTILSIFLFLKKDVRSKAILIYETFLIIVYCADSYIGDPISAKLMWMLCVESSLKVLIGYNLYKILMGGAKTVNTLYAGVLLTYLSLTISIIWVPIYAAITISALVYDKSLPALKPLTIIGDYSFSWYLLHQNIGFVLIIYLFEIQLANVTCLFITLATTLIGAIVLQSIVNKLPKKIIK